MNARVLGLDLSLTSPGLARSHGYQRKAETLRTDPKRGDKRLCDIRDWIEYYVKVGGYELAVIEAVPAVGDRAGMYLTLVHSTAREVLARYDVPYAYVNVTALKSFATSSGTADKAEVMAAVQRWTGEPPADDNAADAVVLQAMGEVFLGAPPPDGQLSTAQHQAMCAVTWPLFPLDASWPQPYGEIRRRDAIRKKCQHKVVAMRNGDHWLHPFTIAVCDKPPK